MKKLCAVFAVLVFLALNVYSASACENPPIPDVSATECNAVYVALVEENHELAGITSPCEKVDRLSVQSPSGNYVRGIQANGNVIRVHATVQYIFEYGIGLTALTNVSVQIDEAFRALVSDIVFHRIGETADPNEAANIIACTLWRPTEDSVAHIFFTSRSNRFVVGKIIFNCGKDAATLYAGDFDGDGTLELGFAAGWTEPPKQEPKPNTPPTPSKTPCTPCKKKCGGCGFSLEIKMCLGVRINFNCAK